MSAVDMATAHDERASVRPATSEEIPRMADVLARAFFDDPAFSWVLREDADRMRVLVRGFELFLRRVWLEQEHTYTTKSVAGVAAWELPDQWKLGVGRQLGLLPAMLRVFGRHSPRVLRAIATLEASHPREPHHYLAFIGVGLLVAVIVHFAEREPSVLAGAMMLFVAFEIGFYGLSSALSESPFFGALADSGINIRMISTSEIRISAVVDAADLDSAVMATHRAFGLEDGQSEAVIYGGTGR